MSKPCLVCKIPLEPREVCPSPACPCYGLRTGSAEAEVAAQQWRVRPSMAARRAMTGAAALSALEMRAWLELTGAAGEALAVEIEHGHVP